MPPSTPPTAPATSPPSLTTRLQELISACFTGLWIETHEPDEAIREITTLARNEHWRLATWDCDSGLSYPVSDSPAPPKPRLS